MGDFFNIKLKINNREENIKIEKGVTFENNGAKYVVGSNGKLQKCDKKNNNIWTEAKEINLTEYQYSVFQSIADNDNKSGLSQEDIVTAFEQYRNSKFKEDIKKNLPEGYTIEATELKSSENWVSLDVKNGDSGAKLIFGIKDTDVSKSANNTKTESDNTNNSNTYTVQAGDSLGKIAEKFGISIKELMKINGIENPDTIYVGQVLKVSQNENVEESNNKEVQTYTVQAGDSLGKIAEKFGIPIKELMKINGIENPDTIYVGQVLKLTGKTEVTENKRVGKTIYDTIPVEYNKYIKKVSEETGVSEDTVRLIMITECHNGIPKTTPYRCSSNVLTIGFGHTNLIGTQSFNEKTTISIEKAFEILASDIKKTIKDVKWAVGETNFDNLPSYAKDSLVDWGFNAGTKRLKKSDNVKANIESKSYIGLITTSVWNNSDPRRSVYRLMNVCKNLNSEQKKSVKKFLDREMRNSDNKISYYDSVCNCLKGVELELFKNFYKNLG